jgi:NADH-quinone oxidoreductase subunit A
MLEKYVPVLLLLLAALGFAAFNILASELLGRRRPGVSKGAAYECGMSPEGTARIRLSIHFYLVAVLFILFDVEALLLIPWALAARSMAAAGSGLVVFAEIAAFVGVLALALAFAWRKGGLTWDR